MSTVNSSQQVVVTSESGQQKQIDHMEGVLASTIMETYLLAAGTMVSLHPLESTLKSTGMGLMSVKKLELVMDSKLTKL